MLFLQPAAICQAAAAEAPARDELYARAVKERLAGDNAAAIAHLQALLASQPDDVDARLQLGLALQAAGRGADAERELREVLRRAPDYKDARVALAQLLWARADAAGARAALGEDLIRTPGDPETRTLVERLRGEKPPANELWRMDASVALSELSRELPAWWEGDFAISRKIDPQSAVTASVQALNRFKLGETYLEAAYDHGWSGGEVSIALGGSLDPTFRPKIAMHAEALLNPWGKSPWSLALTGAVSRYVAGDVETGSIGPDRLIFGDRGRLSARFIVTHDETGQALYGFSTAAAWRFTPWYDAQVSYVDSAETDTGMTVRVRAVGVTQNFTVNDRAIFHLSVTREARENSYDRLEFVLGATAKF